MKKRTPLPVVSGFTILESCLGCLAREDALFCRLPAPALRELDAMRRSALYSEGTRLFSEGEPPRGLFILCAGEAKLSANGPDGRAVTLRLVRKGEVLGLSSVVANKPYPITAETRIRSQVAFISRDDFLRLLAAHAEVSIRVAEHLSAELHTAWQQARLLALAPSAQARLAQLLLQWAEERGQATRDGIRISLGLTQEAIGELTGISRETVSRLLAGFARRRLIRTQGGSITLLRPDQLRSLDQS